MRRSARRGSASLSGDAAGSGLSLALDYLPTHRAARPNERSVSFSRARAQLLAAPGGRSPATPATLGPWQVSREKLHAQAYAMLATSQIAHRRNVCIGEMLLDEGTKMDWSLQASAHTLATARHGQAQARPSCTSHRARIPSALSQ
jgi:hypothetical protein